MLSEMMKLMLSKESVFPMANNGTLRGEFAV